MLNLRPAAGRVVAPLARFLLRVGVTPDMVTVAGTIGAVAGSLAFFPRGSFLVGTLVVTFSVLTDALDGAMARMRGVSGNWGAFLDSTMDRIADATIFSALVLWYAGDGDSTLLLCLALFCLVSGVITSYAKARAEGLGMTANVGIAERLERLIAVLAGTGLAGFGLDIALPIALWLLAAASAITVGQRLVEVHRQATGGPAGQPTAS
jgi:CDP-diacylglycerol--glycerol-3-phosphate 3-phosphatidyltransferase